MALFTTQGLYNDFEIEITKSEYQRTRLMLATFTFGLLVSIANYFLLDETVTQYYGGTANYFFVVVWIGLFILYELGLLFYVSKFLAKGTRIGIGFKIIHSQAEVFLLSGLMYYMVDVHDMVAFLDSSVMLLYFLFLILSVLHLDFRISLFTGIAAAIQYAAVVWYGFHVAYTHPAYELNVPENNFYLRAVVLIISGGAAGFVADEVKRRVKASFDLQNAKTEMELLFGQQVSREVLQALVEDRGTLRKQEATVLALDIRNFSTFAERHSPDEIMDFQNKIFGPILDIINQHQGVVNQILGDGIMATFGTPVSNPLHADMAFQSSLKILEKVKELSSSGVIPPTRIGMGIHTGEVITGNIGNENRKQYSISGTAVIIAFRVEQLNKELGSELLITGDIKERILAGKVAIEFLGAKPLKGLGKNIDVYKVG